MVYTRSNLKSESEETVKGEFHMMYPYMTLPDATKIWITQTGHCILCHNRSKIPVNILNKIMRLIEKNQDDIRKAWIDFFDEITYFC